MYFAIVVKIVERSVQRAKRISLQLWASRTNLGARLSHSVWSKAKPPRG